MSNCGVGVLCTWPAGIPRAGSAFADGDWLSVANQVAQAPRFRLLLERLQAAFAEAATACDPAGIEAWQMASEMARAEDTLNIDKRSIVLRLLERYAAIGRAA